MADLRVVAVGRHQILNEVVGTDGNEIHQIQHDIDRHRCGRNLDHHPKRHLSALFTFGGKRLVSFAHDRPQLSQFLDRRHHREHNTHCFSRKFVGCPDDGANLCVEKFWVFERKTNTTPAHKRVGFVVVLPQIGHRFIATNI